MRSEVRGANSAYESTGDSQHWDEDLPGREEKRSSQGDSLFNGLEV